MNQWLILGAGDPIQVIVVVVFVLAMLFQFFSRLGNAIQRPPPNRMPQQPMPPRPQQPAAPGDSMRSEIEEFLRQASARQGEQQRPGQPQRPPQMGQQQMSQRQPGQPQPGQPQPGQGQMRQTRPYPPRPQQGVVRQAGGRSVPVAVAQRRAAAAAAAAEMADTPEAIDAHVKEFLNTREFSERSAQLSSIDKQEQQFEQHLKQTFAHEVGHLKGDALALPGEAPVASAVATEVSDTNVKNPLIALVSSRAGLRQAIVLNEILHRPEHRW